jgi:sugar phosphate isomerase/epimerase
MEFALNASGVTLTAVNSGRVVAEGLTLLHPEPGIRTRAIARVRDLLDFAGSFGVPVTIAGAKGSLLKGAPTEVAEAIALEAFSDLAEFATTAGSILLLAPTDERDSNCICTVAEAMAWIRRVNSPGLGLMLDTHQLGPEESSVVEGLRAAAGLVKHLHLYDPGSVPPGTGATPPLNWPAILSTLADIAYDGAASVSLSATGDRRALAVQTVAYLRSVMPGTTP